MGIVTEKTDKKGGKLLIDLVNTFFLIPADFGGSCIIIRGFRDIHTAALGQLPYGIRERDIVILLDKTEDITALSAAETVITLRLAVNMKRGGLFLMKRAETDKGRSSAPFQLHIIADEFSNFTAAADLFNDLLIESGHR